MAAMLKDISVSVEPTKAERIDYAGSASSQANQNIQKDIVKEFSSKVPTFETEEVETEAEAVELAKPLVESLQKKVNTAEKIEKAENPQVVTQKNLFKQFNDEKAISIYGDSAFNPDIFKTPSSPEEKKINENNKEIKIKNMSVVEKLYYENLAPELYKRQEELKKKVQELTSDPNNKYAVTYPGGGVLGTSNYTAYEIKPEIQAEIEKAQKEYNKIVTPVNIKYRDQVRSQLADVDKRRESLPFASAEREVLNSVGTLLRDSEKKLDSSIEQKGAWGGFIDEITNPDFISLGSFGLATSSKLMRVVANIEKGKKLEPFEIELLEAYNQNHEVHNNVTSPDNYTAMNNVTATLPWMAQFIATEGVGAAAEKGAQEVLYKGLLKYANTTAKKYIKASAVKTAEKMLAKGIGVSARVLTQSAIMPSTYKDGVERYIGEIRITRNEDGSLKHIYMRDDLANKIKEENDAVIYDIKTHRENYDKNGNLTDEAKQRIIELEEDTEQSKPLSAFSAGKKALLTNSIEALTERIGGEFALKGLKKLGFEDPLSIIPLGKTERFVNSLKNKIGYQGLVPELIEEEMNIPMNAFFVGDSQYSDLWDGKQQKDLFVQTALTGALIGTGSGIIGLRGRASNKEYYKQRREMRALFNELKNANPTEVDKILDLGMSATNTTNMLALQRQYIQEGKKEEAKLVGEKILVSQMMKAFDTHTIEDFKKALNEVSGKIDLPPTTKENIVKTQATIASLEKTYEKHKEKRNVGTIMRLEANKLLAAQAKQEINTNISEIKEDVKADIEALSPKKKGRPSKTNTVLPYATENIFDQDFEDSLEGDAKVEYLAYLDNIKNLGAASIQTLEDLQKAKVEVDIIEKENRVLFNEQISPEFQKKVKLENELMSELRKNLGYRDAIESSDDENFNNQFDKIADKYKETLVGGRLRNKVTWEIKNSAVKTTGLSEKRIAEIKQQEIAFVRKQKAFEELNRQGEIRQKAEEIRLSNQETETPEQATERIELEEKNRVLTQQQEEEKIAQTERNKQFKDAADSLTTLFEVEGDGTVKESKASSQGSIVEEEKLFFEDLPRTLGTLSDEKKQHIKNTIAEMYNVLASALGRKPKFSEIVTEFAKRTTLQQAEEYYNVLSLGWSLNNYEALDFKGEYNKIFDPLKTLANSLIDESLLTEEQGIETREEVEAENKKSAEKINKEDEPIIGFTEEGAPIKPVEGFKTVSSDLKLGFLSMQYDEVINPDGTTERITTSSELQDETLIASRDLLHPDKYNKGEILTVGIPDGSILSQTKITSYENGKKVTTPYNLWVEKGLAKNPDFMTSTEYINSVPMFTYNSEGIPVAYIHGVEWYNTNNIGPNDNPPLQAEIIKNGKAEVAQLRNAIVNEGLTHIEIQSKTGVKYAEIPKGTSALTLNEANPQAILAIGMEQNGQVVAKIGTQNFENNKRVLLNPEKLNDTNPRKNGLGKAYDLRRIGINEKGQETWMAFDVLPMSNTITEEDTSTIKWALAAFFKLSGYESTLSSKTIEYDPNITNITKEEAQVIADKVFKETGYDISNRDDARKFLDLYVDMRIFEYSQFANKYFAIDKTAALKTPLHRSNTGLGINAKMVTISEDKIVTPTNKTYEQYYKNIFKTTVKSFNVGTEEKPVWVTAVQPKIKFGYKQKEAKLPEVVVEEEVKKTVEDVKEAVEKKNPIEDVKNKAQELLKKFGLNRNQSFEDMPVQITDTTAINGVFKTTPGITIQEEATLVDFIFNNISKAIGIDKSSSTNKSKLLFDIRNSYENKILSNKKELQEGYKSLKELYENDPVMYEELVPSLKEMERGLEIYTSIENNWESIQNKAVEKIKQYTGIKEGISEEEVDDISQREKDYSKTSLEEDGKSKSSYRLRRFFAGFARRTADGNPKVGFLGLPEYVGFNEVYDTIAQILSSPNESASSFDEMISRLQRAETSHKWLPDVVEALLKADNQIKREFVYNFTKHALSMKFAMYSSDAKGGYTLKMYDTNANEITKLIKNTWKSNFKMKDLVKTEEGEYAIDKVKAKNLQDQFDAWGDTAPQVDKETVRKWLGEFGIILSDDAWKELVTTGYYISGNGFLSYDKLFTSQFGIFKQLHNYLKDIADTKDTGFEVNENNHPFTNIGRILNVLATLESKYTNQALTLSFRDNGKSIFGLTPNKYATDRVLALKQYNEEGFNELVDQLQRISISSDSYVLQLLQIEEDFRGKFGVDHIGITALKELGKKESPFSSITDLSDIDHDLTKMTGFQDMRQGEVKASVSEEGNLVTNGNGISMRIGRMFLPTMSDKSQMLLLSTGVFNFFKDRKKSFDIDTDNNFSFTETLKNLLFNQLVKPELKRIANFHKNIGSTNIEGYNLGAQIFNFIPAFNNIKDESGHRIIELMRIAPDVYTAEYVEQKFKNQFSEILKKVVDNKVETKLNNWESSLVRDAENKVTKIKFFDKKYLAEAQGIPLETKFKLGMYDFVINSMVTNASMYTVIAGDPALFSTDKLFNNFSVDNVEISRIATIYGKEKVFSEVYNSHKEFLKALDKFYAAGLITEVLYKEMKDKIKPVTTSGTDANYLSLSKTLGVNLGKRLALLLAPGNKIANSKGKKYMQIFLKDDIGMAENINYLVGLYYGKEAESKSKDLIEDYYKAENEAQRNQVKEKLQTSYPLLKDYLFIPSTDAQEYTTVEEHLNILENQGRIPDNKLVEIRETLAEGKNLTKAQLDFVLQPIKPVYTGQVIDEKQDVARTIYIKSSSFPLLPQMTKGRRLNDLRLKMEELEKQGNGEIPVRASYQSANKVGAMNNPIDPFNKESLATAGKSALILSRDNFRIQQDVPFKSDLKKEDKISMGTQIFKLLFGDGMLDQENFNINGEILNGRQLYDYFNDNFSKLIEIKKKGLYRELGLTADGLPIDEEVFIKKLQKLLQSEAIDRGYPRQDVEGLSFVQKVGVDGIPYYDFKLPLWLSSNSNRYEALLNAIVTNRIIKQKMPGNSFVVGSEVGFEMSEDIADLKDSGIINIGGHKGGPLKGVQDTDGKFTYAEIYAPSKFKDNNGKLIDLYEKDKTTDKYKYLIETKENGLQLKEGVIDPILLNNFSFRTPTSFHASASIIKVVGFLPPVNGDLMIVPKNFIAQKGIDFDIDKENTYQLWNVLNKRTGKIEVISKVHKEQAIKGLRKRLETSSEETVERDVNDPLESFISSAIGKDYSKTMEDTTLNLEEKIEAISEKFEQKILENEFIKVHMALYANPSVPVQQKINKVLSMDFASGQADFIDELINENIDDSNFTILSDDYQKAKMGLGAAGKMAIGVYSNYVTFHSLSQQIETPIHLENGLGGRKEIQIGNFKSDGVLGNILTLDGDRNISEVLAEKQNTATDNEKEQILGRVNVNGITINVDAILTLLGFDKGEKIGSQETSIPYLFLSQPIIKDFVKMTQESQAITSVYNHNKDKMIIAALTKKYTKEYEKDKNVPLLTIDEFNRLTPQLTSANMINEISSEEGSIPGLQLAVLQQFLELKDYATELSSIQGVVNTTSLGKSIVESNQKMNRLSNLPDSKTIVGAQQLIGDYILTSRVKSKPDGYILVGKYYVKSNTPQGHIVLNGITVGNSLWNSFFPYADDNIRAVVAEIEEITNSSEKSDTRKIEMQFAIFKEIKKYINSNFKNGLFTDNASVERKQLFIDTKTHMSLASYMNNLKNTKISAVEDVNKEGVYNLKNSRLFTKFEFDLNSNGEPSLIKFNNTAKENFDEDYLYTAIAEMTINKYPLPNKNGEPYDTRKLAADLVAYAYLEGGVQEAIQFAKYIPIEYLEDIGFAEQMQKYSPKKATNIFHRTLGIKEFTEENNNQTHTFVKQYIQHNPGDATQFDPSLEKNLFQNPVKEKNKLISFKLNAEEFPKFISKRESTKSKRKQDKFSLFQHIGNGEYQRISILGAFGMNEYDFNNENAHSLLDDAEPAIVKNSPNVKKSSTLAEMNDIFKVLGGNTEEILTKIAGYRDSKYRHFPKLVEFLLPLVKNNLTIVVGDTSENGTRAKANGRTITEKGSDKVIIMIDSDLMTSNNHTQIARTFIHEFVHSVTINELGKYFDKETKKQLVPDLPLHVSRLLQVFNATKVALGPELDAFNIKRNKHLKGELPSDTGYSAEELEVTYAGSNIFEFVTTALTEPAFQEKMSETEFRKSGESLWNRFKSTVMNLLFANSINIKPDSITFEALSSTLDFIEVEAEANSSNNKIMTAPKQNRYGSEEFIEVNRMGKEPAIEDQYTDIINNALNGLDLPMTEKTKKEIDTIFEENPVLQNIGSKEEYLKFLGYSGRNTIPYSEKLKEITSRKNLASKEDLENSLIMKNIRVDKSQPKALMPNDSDIKLGLIMLYGETRPVQELLENGYGEEVSEAKTLAYRILNDLLFDIDELLYYGDSILKTPEYLESLKTNENPIRDFFNGDVFELTEEAIKKSETEEFRNYINGLTSESLDNLPDICN